MAFWIFKYSPEIYHFAERLADPNPDITWTVSRYRKQIGLGDTIFVWETGRNRGIRAILRAEGVPQDMAELETEQPYYAERDTAVRCRVRATIIRRDVNLSSTDLRLVPGLENLSVFHGFQQGSNFPMTPEEGAILLRLVTRTDRQAHRAAPDDQPEWAEVESVPQYWVVGASWGGREDQFEEFIRESYWLLGWDEGEQPDQEARRNRIRPGDRIAIKKISTHPNIEIRAVGVVKKIDPANGQVHVRWVASDLHHQVYSRGCYKSIHGPYDPDDEWTRDVFRLDDLEHLLDDDDLPDVDDGSLLAQEGAKRWRLHLVTERNRKNVERKKAQVKLEKGSLECEACGFDFARFYGNLGSDFCEVHHKIPLSLVDAPVRLKLEDLAIVCSNCHRMIHKTSPMISVEDLRNRLFQRAI